MEISALPMGQSHQARTLIQLSPATTLEVATEDLRVLAQYRPEIKEQLAKELSEFPFETVVYKLIPAKTALSEYESIFPDSDVYILPGVGLNGNDYLFSGNWRRDLDLGDLYLSHSRHADAAAMEHDKVVREIISGEMLLMTQDERLAVYGPNLDLL